jgi:hypothetical protein
MRVACILALGILLASCGGEEPAPEQKASATANPGDVAAIDPGAGAGIGTPNEERVATLALLNKRNNLTQDLVMKTGEERRIGRVIVKLASCERSLPWERPEEVGAFVQVLVDERAVSDGDPDWRKVFSGWLFKNSPALNVVEHPVYDVWVKDCAMSFPGEEDRPAPAASASNAENASGSESASPAPAPGPAPAPAE